MKSVPECHFVVGIVAMETWKCDTWNSYQNLNNLYYFSVYMYMIWKIFITEQHRYFIYWYVYEYNSH